jgi:hypothetical protein
MNFNNDEEALDFFNRLLDRLRQAGYDQHGSHFQLVYVAPGAQHVERQTLPSPPCLGREKSHMNQAKTQSQEDQIRQSIALLMEERYGAEPLFNLQGHWQAVYRILVDKGFCRDSDFDGFDAFIRRVMPEEVNKPYKKDSVKQISQTDFIRPFDEWAFDMQTSKTRRPFDRMVTIARRFREILEENGL